MKIFKEEPFREISPESEISMIEFSADEFIKILSSEKFLKALSAAANETAKSGYETGFYVRTLDDKTVYIPEVIKGGTESMVATENWEEISVIDGEIAASKEHEDRYSGIILDVHFHPSAEGAIIPSTEDFLKLGAFPGIMSFVGMGKVKKEEGKIDLLLIKTLGHTIIKNELSDYREKMSSAGFVSDQNEINELIKKEGFDVYSVSFNQRNKKYRLSQKSEKLLKDIKSINVVTQRQKKE